MRLGEAKVTQVEATLDRSVLYQFLSLCFLEPNDKTVGILGNGNYRREIEEAFFRYKNLFAPNEEADALEGILSAALGLLEGVTLGNIAPEHRRFFGGHVISKDCPICEGFHGTNDISQLTNELADVAGFYRAFGLQPSRELKERVDHLGTELEFMHFLTYKEAYSLENEEEGGKVTICTDAQKRFLKDHLGRWVGFFSRLVERKSNDGLYPRLARFLKGFISLEMKHLGVETEEVNELNVQILDMKKEEDFNCSFSPETASKEEFPC